jgi:colanic acid biosynthesis glycosyl transferase WcaI
MISLRIRRTPWILWVQDIVTDGAATTGLLEEGPLLKAARSFERMTYSSASRVVVISDAFRQNLRTKGVPDEKINRIFNPSSRQVLKPIDLDAMPTRPQILAMGNIGHSQGLDRIVEAFQESSELETLDTQLLIVGHGVAANDVRDRIESDRVQMPGVLYGEQFESVLKSASIGLVSQRANVQEFNLPSKLMTYMACGIPVLASVNPDSETARIVRDSNAGWVTDSQNPSEFAAVAAAKLGDSAALKAASRAGFTYANDNFQPKAIAEKFEAVLEEVLSSKALLR